MTKLPPAINQFLQQLERQAALRIGDEETEEADVPLEAVIEAMVEGKFFYDRKKKGFYQQLDYGPLESSAVEVSRQEVIYFVADYLEDYYGEDYYKEAVPEIEEEKEEKEETEEKIRKDIKPEISAEETAAGETAAAPLEKRVDETTVQAAAPEIVPETPAEAEPREPEKPYTEFPASDTDPNFRLPEFTHDSGQSFSVSGEFETPPSGTQPREQREATIIAMPPPPPAEKEKRERWEAKRSKLAFGLQNDDLSVGEKSFMSYLAYLEENPKLSLPGKGDEPARKEYIAHFFQGAVAIRGKKAAIDYLDALEAIMIGAGEETAGNFAGLAPDLYCRLPSEKANEYIAKGMRITESVERRAYFQRESREAQDILAALVDGELVKVNREYASARAKLKEAGGKYSALEREKKKTHMDFINLNGEHIRQTAELKDEKQKYREVEDKVKGKESTIASLLAEAEKKEGEWGKKTDELKKKMKWKMLGVAAAAFLAGAAAAYTYFEDKIDSSTRCSETENPPPPSF